MAVRTLRRRSGDRKPTALHTFDLAAAYGTDHSLGAEDRDGRESGSEPCLGYA